MRSIVISGYYGFGNVGDEAVLAGIRAGLRELGVEAQLTVPSGDPRRTMREHPGVLAIPRMRPLPLIRALRDCDLCISGGGSLFQDVTSVRSPYYYLTVLRLAQMLKRRTMIYAQGVGPLFGAGVRRRVAAAFSRTDAITVRDGQSMELLREIGVTREVQVVADPAFLVEPDLQAADRLIQEAGLKAGNLVGIALRPWPGYEDWIREAAAAILETCGELGLQVAFIPMQESQDSASCAGAPILRHGGIPGVAKGLIARCELVVGMRLHSLIFAASLGVPFVPIAYDPKVSAFATEAGARTGAAIGEPTKQLTNAMWAAWNDRESYREALEQRSQALREAALLPARLAAELLGQPGFGTLA